MKNYFTRFYMMNLTEAKARYNDLSNQLKKFDLQQRCWDEIQLGQARQGQPVEPKPSPHIRTALEEQMTEVADEIKKAQKDAEQVEKAAFRQRRLDMLTRIIPTVKQLLELCRQELDCCGGRPWHRPLTGLLVQPLETFLQLSSKPDDFIPFT
ncbi:hypothetical protein AYO44_10545 [Planctomycetaceae bacterium SCGC AG-212-F19]|nr:hypothetical protein AYO44_10545 [Planctomycetaceae bacterium SCGC AG-212-F19]